MTCRTTAHSPQIATSIPANVRSKHPQSTSLSGMRKRCTKLPIVGSAPAPRLHPLPNRLSAADVQSDTHCFPSAFIFRPGYSNFRAVVSGNSPDLGTRNCNTEDSTSTKLGNTIINVISSYTFRNMFFWGKYREECPLNSDVVLGLDDIGQSLYR
ncbi:hypothetical protein AVEN_121024-1 [Araneus ventricosus]|uniref:Uncharacterized protein n=1 Tax=Araneus ventricosus TaxID=182803 RepID=A0A4Y2WIY3_ARAVE|nr:hypothetical protein AVEN_245310-1 [Araneus ventricosus]GBO36565.1 hypothetical protein AVEN_205331-1 [Araneus ventricosus]GBO36618.1 hypothetical protein AVEN_40887-1 [Araneus ventricosus]GBO36623.1 hypothetical protein AVEN_121024-1 [Araneus ventricosus]